MGQNLNKSRFTNKYPARCKENLDQEALKGVFPFPWRYNYFTRNETQEQYSLLDTIFDYIFYFGPPGKYL